MLQRSRFRDKKPLLLFLLLCLASLLSPPPSSSLLLLLLLLLLLHLHAMTQVQQIGPLGLSGCLSGCLSRLSVCLYVCLSGRLSVCVSVCRCLCLSVCLSVRLSVFVGSLILRSFGKLHKSVVLRRRCNQVGPRISNFRCFPAMRVGHGRTNFRCAVTSTLPILALHFCLGLPLLWRQQLTPGRLFRRANNSRGALDMLYRLELVLFFRG